MRDDGSERLNALRGFNEHRHLRGPFGEVRGPVQLVGDRGKASSMAVLLMWSLLPALPRNAAAAWRCRGSTPGTSSGSCSPSRPRRRRRPRRCSGRPVDGRAGQAEEKGVRQRLAHLAAEIAFLRAVRLVHHHDDVRCGI